MNKFIPKQYINGEITQDNCNHELLSISGFDEGIYGTNYECLICGKHLHYSIFYKSADMDGKYIYQSYGYLTPYNIKLIKNMLTFIAERYINEEFIDIANIFNNISSSLENISSLLNKQTEIDKKLIRKKYQDINK